MSWRSLPGQFGLILVREPLGACHVCGSPFFSDRDMRAHFASREHHEAMEAALADRVAQKRRLAFIHSDDENDVEIEAHLRKVGQRMRREGRWELKPNERAGFS